MYERTQRMETETENGNRKCNMCQNSAVSQPLIFLLSAHTQEHVMIFLFINLFMRNTTKF